MESFENEMTVFAENMNKIMRERELNVKWSKTQAMNRSAQGFKVQTTGQKFELLEWLQINFDF